MRARAVVPACARCSRPRPRSMARVRATRSRSSPMAAFRAPRAVSASAMSVRRRRSAGRSRSSATATSSNSMPRRAPSTSSFRPTNWPSARPSGRRVRPNSAPVICGNTPSRLGRPSKARSPIRAGRARRRAMRIAEFLLRAVVIGAGLLAAPAMAFDGTKSTDAMAAAPPLSAMEAFKSGAHWLKAGEKAKAVHSLEYAAEKGHALAQWKLGRMYAEGDGVTQDDLKAFEYFRGIADSHAEDNPDTPQSRFVANAFVALGHYYLDGIPKTAVRRDPDRAREMFAYAASYFRDSEAQYYLARLYLDGVGAPHDPRQAARWFGLSAQKGQCQSQAMLGAMLFAGDHVPRQAARGLMWLTLAKDSAKEGAATDQDWINRLYDSAFQQATEDERALALVYLKRWMETRRE